MAQVQIFMYSLGDEKYLVDTLYVQGYDNKKEIEKIMIDLGMPPSGWNSGYYYTAEINSCLDSKNAMTVDQFKEHLTPKPKKQPA